MKDAVKFAGFDGVKKLGVYRYLRKKNRDKAVVLTYHGVLPKIPAGENNFEYRNFITTARFEKQIKFLLKHYRPLRVEDFYDHRGNIAGGFLITFDDGFRNNFRHAMPILKKYGLQGCFFISTGLIGTRNLLWTEEVTRMLEKSRQPFVEVQLNQKHLFKLNGRENRSRASQIIRKYMKSMPAQRVQEVMLQLKSQLSDVVLTVGSAEEERYLFMSWNEVREMVQTGQYIGSHTHTHPMLATLSEEESFRELSLSKTLIEKETGQPCLAMSYPNGERENYSEIQIRQLKELGFRSAFTQIPHFNTPKTDRYQLRRINISLKMSMPVFEAVISGFM
jgi:peptidoglycan/xylan/chitin deacetylase (PgdA/CDA1 family)